MTKEKTIINEIDVTECTYRIQNPHNLCMCASIINESGNIIELTRYVQCEYNPNCYFKQLARAIKENEELRRYHNKCCKENTEKLEQWLEKYNQLSRDFYNGKYCNKENCSLLKAKAQECEELETMVAEAEEAPICFHCKEEPCIRQERDKYKQALNEIENYVRDNSDFDKNDKLTSNTGAYDILEIINKAKENIND